MGNSRPFLHYEKSYSLSLYLSQSHFMVEWALSLRAFTLLSSSSVHNFTLFFVLFRSTIILSGVKLVVEAKALKALLDWLEVAGVGAVAWEGRWNWVRLTEADKIRGRLSWKASPLHIFTFWFFVRIGSTSQAHVNQVAIRFGEES